MLDLGFWVRWFMGFSFFFRCYKFHHIYPLFNLSWKKRIINIYNSLTMNMYAYKKLAKTGSLLMLNENKMGSISPSF
jgi:hypothetical protein